MHRTIIAIDIDIDAQLGHTDQEQSSLRQSLPWLVSDSLRQADVDRNDVDVLTFSDGLVILVQACWKGRPASGRRLCCATPSLNRFQGVPAKSTLSELPPHDGERVPADLAAKLATLSG